MYKNKGNDFGIMTNFVLEEAVNIKGGGIRGVSLLFLSPRLYSRERNSVPTVQKVGWASGSV